MSNELTLQEAALAWAQGKNVEAIDKFGLENWKRVDGVGVDNPDNRTCYAGVFNRSGLYRFRLAQEPPAKRYRQWTLETAPIGFVIRKKRTSCWWQVYTVVADGVMLRAGDILDNVISFQDCLTEYDHTTDGGKTWLPCGVEVES